MAGGLVEKDSENTILMLKEKQILASTWLQNIYLLCMELEKLMLFLFLLIQIEKHHQQYLLLMHYVKDKLQDF